VPVKLTVCGVLDALSAIFIEAALDPALVGLNVTVIMQLPPLGTEAPQVFVCPKSLAFSPEIVIPVIVSAAVPEFVSVTFWGAPAVLTV